MSRLEKSKIPWLWKALLNATPRPDDAALVGYANLLHKVVGDLLIKVYRLQAENTRLWTFVDTIEVFAESDNTANASIQLLREARRIPCWVFLSFTIWADRRCLFSCPSVPRCGRNVSPFGLHGHSASRTARFRRTVATASFFVLTSISAAGAGLARGSPPLKSDAPRVITDTYNSGAMAALLINGPSKFSPRAVGLSHPQYAHQFGGSGGRKPSWEGHAPTPCDDYRHENIAQSIIQGTPWWV